VVQAIVSAVGHIGAYTLYTGDCRRGNWTKVMAHGRRINPSKAR